MFNRIFIIIFWLIPLESKISLPAFKAQQKDLMLVAIRLLSLLRLLFYFLIFFLSKTFHKIHKNICGIDLGLGLGANRVLKITIKF